MDLDFLKYLSKTIRRTPFIIKLFNLFLLIFAIYISYMYGSIHYLLRIVAFTILVTSLSTNYYWAKQAKKEIEENGKYGAEIFFSGLILLALPFFFFNFISSLIELGSYSLYNLGISSIYSIFLTSIYFILLAIIVESKVRVTKLHLAYDYKENTISIYESQEKWEEEKDNIKSTKYAPS